MQKISIGTYFRIRVLLPVLILVPFLFYECKEIGYSNGESVPGAKSDFSTNDGYPDLIKVRTFQNQDSSWGYMIFINGKLTVYQRTVPGKDDSHGFKTEIDAGSAANLVSKKLIKEDGPVRISERELDSLGIERS